MSGHRVSTANIAFRWFRSGINLGRKPPLRWCCWETLKKVLTEGSKTLQPPYPTNIIRAIKVLALQEAGVPHAVASRISTSCHLRCKPVGPETSLSPHFTHTLHHVNHTTPSSKDFLLSTYTLTKTAQVMYIYIYICIPNSENSMLETRFLGQCFYMWAALLIESLQKQCLLWNFFMSQNLCWNIP